MKYDIAEIITKLSAIRDKSKVFYETLDALTNIVQDGDFWQTLCASNTSTLKEKDYD
jgi:hypothetical protein